MLHDVLHPPFQAKQNRVVTTVTCFKPRPWRCCPKPVGSPSEVWFFFSKTQGGFPAFRCARCDFCNSHFFFGKFRRMQGLSCTLANFVCFPSRAYIPQVKPWVFCNPTTKKTKVVEFGGCQGCPKTRFLAFLLGFTTSLGLENPSTRDTVHGHNWIQYNHQIQIHLKSSMFTWCSPPNPSKMHINPTFFLTWQSSTYHHLLRSKQRCCEVRSHLSSLQYCSECLCTRPLQSINLSLTLDSWEMNTPVFLLSDHGTFSMGKFHMLNFPWHLLKAPHGSFVLDFARSQVALGHETFWGWEFFGVFGRRCFAKMKRRYHFSMWVLRSLFT